MPKRPHEHDRRREPGRKHGPRPGDAPPPPPHDEHEHEHGLDFGDLSVGTDVFMRIREQNIELLKLAAQVAGYGGAGGPKMDDPRPALDQIWGLYSEFQDWIDPETDDEHDEDE